MLGFIEPKVGLLTKLIGTNYVVNVVLALLIGE